MNKKDKHNNYGKLVAAAENGAREREREGRAPLSRGQMSLNRCRSRHDPVYLCRGKRKAWVHETKVETQFR